MNVYDDMPYEWHILGREADLAAEQLAMGVTLLGKANHAQKGIYFQAFFALSIGLERTAKLVLISDHATRHKGAFPSNKFLRTMGHDIVHLLDSCDELSDRWRAGRKPKSYIHKAIISALSDFAKLTRYYNLDYLTQGEAAELREPIDVWWKNIGIPILEKHYAPARRQKVEAKNRLVGALCETSVKAVVWHHDETNQLMSNIECLMNRAAETKIVQKYSRLYILQIIRWLSLLIFEISHEGGYQNGIAALAGIHERFAIFNNDDDYFKKRKTWSIYNP